MRPGQAAVIAGSTCFLLGLSLVWAGAQAPPPPQARPAAPVQHKPQTRLHGQPVQVDPASVTIDDGDSIFIRWADGDLETVRILGIDTPETLHDGHGIPIAQPLGPEARAFAQGAFAVATDIKMIRAGMLDPYDRTLAYYIGTQVAHS